MNSMKKPFCYAAWTSMVYGGNFYNGGASPCCEWKGERFTGKILDYENSDYLKKFRQAMTEHNMDTINQYCTECIATESLGMKSARNQINDKVNKSTWKVGKINKLDYRPDNLCNLKCRMCSPGSSSLIEEEQLSIGFLKEPIVQHPTDDILELDFSELKELAVVGGEPTVNPRIWKSLDTFIENGKNKDIRLSYTTNATSSNEKWLSRVKKFDDVHCNLSLDAAGKAYEYIRTGAEWNKIEKNVPKLIENSSEYNIQLVVQMNSFAIIEDWIEYFLQFPPEIIRMTEMQGVAGRLDCIPDHIKEQKIDYLKKINHPTADQAIKHFEMYEYNQEEVFRYMRWNGWQDAVRKTNILDVDPIFEEILSYRNNWNYYRIIRNYEEEFNIPSQFNII